MNVRVATDVIWEGLRKGVHCPPELRGKLTIDEAYQVQLGILDRWVKSGEHQAGWKVGLTAESIRRQVGYHEPVFGVLLASGHKPSGSTFAMGKLLSPCFESELCLTVGWTLKGPGVTVDEARSAISAAAPAFELVEQRATFSEVPPLSIADNALHKGFITGAALEPLPPGFALKETTVEVVINGETVARARGEAVMGDPAASVAWLANTLSQFDRRLEAGMRIMSGSFVPMFPVRAGDRIEARFDPIGVVTAHFRG